MYIKPYKPQQSKAIASMGLLIYGGQRVGGGQKECREREKEGQKEKSFPSSRRISSFLNSVRVAVKADQSRKIICVLSWKWVKEWRQREGAHGFEIAAGCMSVLSPSSAEKKASRDSKKVSCCWCCFPTSQYQSKSTSYELICLYIQISTVDSSLLWQWHIINIERQGCREK